MHTDEKLNNVVRDLIEMGGDKVGLHTDACVTFQKTHKNCKGCQYELGCSKQVKIMLTTLNPDTQEDLIDRILAAKTVKDVLAIPNYP